MSTVAHTGIHGRRPALITDAGMSRQEEFELRRRRYGRLMIGRVVCIIAAFVVGSVWSNIWLAGVFIAFAAVLPWAAVLIANDRLPLAAAERRADRHAAPAAVPQLTASTTPAERTEHRVIEG